MNKCIIVCGYKPLILKDYKDALLIGVDKGALYLANSNVKMDYAIGDFDSVCLEEFLEIKKFASEVIKLNPIKDDTDLEHTLNFVKEMGYTDIDVYGCLGGRQDHNLLNLKLLYLSDLNIKYYDEKHKIFSKSQGTHKIYKENYKYLSLFVFEKCVLSLSGTYYPIFKTTLTITDNYTTSNEILDDYCLLTIEEGKMLVILCND